jgi:hypothetical protein
LVRRRSLNFFKIRERKEEDEDSNKYSVPELPPEREQVPDNPEQAPGWKLVRTVYGTKKVLCLHFRTAHITPCLVAQQSAFFLT